MSKRIAILGAGGVGASIAAYLIKEGHDVTLIDQWATHIEKIKNDGLKLTDTKCEFIVPVNALHISDMSNLKAQFDVIYLTVKSYDTRWSTYAIEPFLKSTGFMLPAQNSLNDEIVANVIGLNRTVGCVTTIDAAVYEPGHVIRLDHMNNECFIVGELSGLITPRVREIVDELSVFGPSKPTSNIWGVRWSKMIYNCMNNALSGIIGDAIFSLNIQENDICNLIRVAIGREAVQIAQAIGIILEPICNIHMYEFVEAYNMDNIMKLRKKLEMKFKDRYSMTEITKRLGIPNRPSLLQDVNKGRRTEIEYLNGFIVKKGIEVGIATPMNQAIVNIMKKVEEKQVKPGPSNLNYFKNYLIDFLP